MSADRSENTATEDFVDIQSREAFKITTPNRQPDYDWTRQPIPPELRLNQEDDSLHPTLRQILAWSLNVSCQPSDSGPGGGNTDGEDTGSSSKDPSNPASERRFDSQELTPPATASNQFKSDGVSGKHVDEAPAVLQSTAGVGQRPFKTQNGTYGILASTLDLISALKPRADTGVPPLCKPADIARRTLKVSECTGCFDEFAESETSKLPCNHSYCKQCLTKLVLTALQNESSYPPKCCLTEIPLQTALLPLDTKQREIFKEKAAEYSVPAQQRWYCPGPKCLRWIPPEKMQRIRNGCQKCPHCASKICSICRGLAHDKSADCPQDFGLKETNSLAELEGWRRCFSCRALVERTTGCRHMTCKCGSQFCYVCGTKWRTCECTEVDEANRQAGLRRRRQERRITVDTEADELARAIAEVEALESREAQERQRQQERHEAERRREEAELARLEEERQREEAARRWEEELLEREYRQALRLSVEETCNAMLAVMNGLIGTQKQRLDGRHLRVEQLRSGERDAAIEKRHKEAHELQTKMESNVNRRAALFARKHQSELDVFNAEQDELEDDLFLDIQMHLHGKTDKEARERRLQEKFKTQRDEKKQDLIAKQSSETKVLTINATMELDILKRANDDKMANVKHAYLQELEMAKVSVSADLAWFRVVSERRLNMMSANERLMLEALNAGDEPTGLTEELAARIGPFVNHSQPKIIPRRHNASTRGRENSQQKHIRQASAASSMSQPPSPTLVEVAVTSEHLLFNLNPKTPSRNGDRIPTTASATNLSTNSAWAWMTETNQARADSSRLSAKGLTRKPVPPQRNQEIHSDARLRIQSMSPNPALVSGALSASQQILVDGGLQASRHRNEPGIKGVQSLRRDGAPPVPTVPAVYLEDSDLLAKIPGAFPVSPKVARPAVAEGPALLAARYTYQRHSLTESCASDTMTPSSSASNYSTPPSSVASLALPSTNASDSVQRRSLSPSALAALPFSSPTNSPLKPRHQTRGMFSFSDLRAAVTGGGGSGKTKKPKYTEEEIKERMRGTVGDAFSA
ncbi:hypothetical protein LTR99_008893 [Exophiala xenobiotica]|nr:hypothetical protein LTR92_009481 [Exophiala xenobiotica]KAK5265755.1 hypothetical protein LTR96_009162 [Exophiala xenobiotica]KAK5296526.1 hypothetical protein LTR99_008893 [Exophiala xenobiotica]KAK5334579.1 hypothetical protein LTR98_009533 [Exophiala xenobiotica]KAK5427716.1 hypothetical protein LTR34_008658 [Exophiala xenobiotica]